MKKNMGTSDRIIRIALAILFSTMYFTETVTGVLAYVFLGIGAIFIFTSVIGFCPVYTALGMKTCKTE